MDRRLLRSGEVEEPTGPSRSSMYRLIEEDAFPRPVKVSASGARRKASDMAPWIQSRPLSRSEPHPSDALPEPPAKEAQSGCEVVVPALP